MSTKPNILIVNGYLEVPLRTSIRDLIYAFHRNTKCNAFFYSIEQGPIPAYLKKVKFDLVVFTTLLLGERWGGQSKMYEKVYKPLEHLRDIDAIKVIHPQDEWIHTTALNNFINDFKVNHVFSVAPESEWPKIYEKVDFNRVKFHRVLTGYLADQTVNEINKIIEVTPERKIDIGYRAYKSPPWLGRHGYLKTKIADVFQRIAPASGFSIDISTEKNDTKLGNDWLNFLANCKYFIGVEGGSTVIDPDGFIFKKGTEYHLKNPAASFEDFEQNCFPGMDGNLQLFAVSPRHLEACAAKTCQVLIEGSYNDILIPHKHYIELKKDFSNIKEVLEKMKNEELRKQIVETAYRDIVASHKYSYIGYTDQIILISLNKAKLGNKGLLNYFHLQRNRISEQRFWKNKMAFVK